MSERSKRQTPSILGPESVLPTQFFRNLHADRALRSGECQLLVAVMADAIECYQKYHSAADSSGQRLFREAEEWLMTAAGSQKTEANQPSFSFEYCCEILGIDADSVRTVLRRWRPPHEHAA